MANTGRNRREFLKAALGGFLALGGLGLGEAHARRLAPDKPILTEASMNAFLRRHANQLPSYFVEAQADLGVFLEKYFTLTTKQKDYFDNTYRRDKTQWDNFFAKIGPGVKSNKRMKNPPTIKTYPRPPKRTPSSGTTQCVGDKTSGGCCMTSEAGTVVIVWGGANPDAIICS